MSEQTKIQWADSTANFWEGCTKISAGCANCYAETRNHRFGMDNWGKGKPRRKSKSAVKDCLAWNKKPWVCECGKTFTKPNDNTQNACPDCHGIMHRRRIFSLSLGDWLDPEVPIEWLGEMLDTIRQCDQVTWILCTKRPELWRERLLALPIGKPEWIASWLYGSKVPKNIILLTSVENQPEADLRIPELLKIPAVVHGLSLEPLLGPVDISTGTYASNGNGLVWDAFGKPAHVPHCDYKAKGIEPPNGPGIDWLIIGGESGTGARPCNVEWIRSLVEQGKAANVATFVKQLGSNPLQYSKEEIRHPKGGDPAEWPEDLRVQEWPQVPQ